MKRRKGDGCNEEKDTHDMRAAADRDACCVLNAAAAGNGKCGGGRNRKPAGNRERRCSGERRRNAAGRADGDGRAGNRDRTEYRSADGPGRDGGSAGNAG